MTILYRVVTKHTKEMLLDFIRFSYKVRHPKSAYRMAVMGVGFILIGFLARESSKPLMVMAFVLGVATIALVFLRRYIALARLTSKDYLYQKEIAITLGFGQGGFWIQEGDNPGATMKYGEITQVYKDKANFFISINNEEVQVLPYGDFAEGNVERFEGFIQDKTKRQIIHLDISFKERIKMIKNQMKIAEVEHDQKIEEMKKKK
ncbi:hypothetical protein M2454_002135 [Aequitasia blattaphilus]|uniref:YcxB family protein n=1 Tax=Aequitasia blattaphilus TaxID=2949332 RepID=A0ABT1ED67_9FIRM|nr:YcxB family protein [Aequitasia blattaphilus]MCP1102902.1 YcxB family protein [Aequitasia blattaphilus]MCR8615542.1 YcxB family protein [Aequitasia blattaphilus]